VLDQLLLRVLVAFLRVLPEPLVPRSMLIARAQVVDQLDVTRPLRGQLVQPRGRGVGRDQTGVGRLGIGRAGTSTPTGRFSLTDKLRGRDYGSYYGCCILALSGHQTHTPRGWTGGARLAIHGGAYGAVSAGCLHASTGDLRYLMRVVRLGTQIVIHA
jgi:hypothetical protein